MRNWLEKTVRDGQEGFWLPVGGSWNGDEDDESPALSAKAVDPAFAVWMEYDPELRRFLGTIRLGHFVHVEAYRVLQRKGEWYVDADEETDAFVAAKVDGNWPVQAFTIDGYEDEWICVVDPYT